MEFGRSTYVIPERIDAAYIDRYRAGGMTCFEIGAKPVFVDPDDARQHVLLREHLSITGTRVHSIHAGYELRFTIASDDRSVREEAIRQTRIAARIVVALGGDVVVVHPGGSTPEVADGREYLDRIYREAPRLVEAVTDEGARVAFENAMPGHYPDTPDALMGLVESFPPEKVGVCIDTGHANCTPWKTEFIRRSAGRIITTHLHDNDGRRDMHAAPGRGAVDWDKVMCEFHSAGYAGPWIFECGEVGEPVFDEVAESVTLLTNAWRCVANGADKTVRTGLRTAVRKQAGCRPTREPSPS